MRSIIENQTTFWSVDADPWLMYQWAKPTAESIKDDRATDKPTIAPERLPLATANIRYLSSIITQLEELLSEPEIDEYGTLHADKTSCLEAYELLTNAAIVSAIDHNRIIPDGCASTDSEGGVRIEWVRPSSGVRLVIPAKRIHDAYIYHESGNAFHTETATAEALAHWLSEME